MSVPPPGAVSIGRAAAHAGQPRVDRVAQPAAIRRHGPGVEPGSPVVDEDAHRPGRHAHEDVDPVHPRVLGRVGDRLPRRVHEGVEHRVEGQVGGLDQADAHAVGVLDLADDRAKRRPQGGGRARIFSAVEPGPQLAVLAAREALRPLAVRLALDQGQRLEHRVVEPPGDPLALLDPDPLAPLRLGLCAHPAQAGGDE